MGGLQTKDGAPIRLGGTDTAFLSQFDQSKFKAHVDGSSLNGGKLNKADIAFLREMAASQNTKTSSSGVAKKSHTSHHSQVASKSRRRSTTRHSVKARKRPPHSRKKKAPPKESTPVFKAGPPIPIKFANGTASIEGTCVIL